jgi:predicted MPP superfamily phosphohydrolase
LEKKISPPEDLFVSEKTTILVAALADIHFPKTSSETLHPLFTAIAESADILLLCGDIVDYGLPEEARLFTRDVPHPTLLLHTIFFAALLFAQRKKQAASSPHRTQQFKALGE